MNRKLKLLAIVFSALFAGAIVAAISQQYILNNNATVSDTMTLTFYLDGQVWNGVDPVDWGTVSKGTTYTYPLDVENTGEFDAVLSVTVIDLEPTWTCTWDLDGQTVALGETKYGVLTLMVPADAALGEETWQVQITGEEV